MGKTNHPASKKSKSTTRVTAQLVAKTTKPSTKSSNKTTRQTTPSSSLTSFLGFIDDNFVLLLGAIILFVGGFFYGSLWTENQMLKQDYSGSTAGLRAALPSLGSGDSPGAGAEVAPPVATPDPAQQLAAFVAVDQSADHLRGNPDASIMIVEYSDFNCSFCKKFHPAMQAVLAANDDLAWVYRHMPILGSNKEAEASECAAKLGGDQAFWGWADAYFETAQEGVSNGDTDKMISIATGLGINAAEFKQCLEGGEMSDKVAADQSSGKAVGISGTPGSIVVVKGEAKELIPGAFTQEKVQKIIDSYR